MEDLIARLSDQLMAYFGDQDRDAAVAELRRDFKDYPETQRIFKEGLAHALDDPSVDRVRLVESAANVAVHGSAERARRWLCDLQSDLFPAP
jgi:hypothetical protein